MNRILFRIVLALLLTALPAFAQPVITVQPSPVLVATNGACAFYLATVPNGPPATYQWYRNQTALTNGGNVSGATSSLLVISNATTADAFAGNNGYYCVVALPPSFSTNSITNSLVLIPATNLTWTGYAGSTWDVNNTINWADPDSNPTVFNFGDPVVLNDDYGQGGTINLSGPYLSPASVAIDTANTYAIQGNGSLAGPMSLTFDGEGGSGELVLNANNIFTGGTTLTDGSYTIVENYNGFGTGPINLSDEGGAMELEVNGSVTNGFIGPVNVNDDYNLQLDENGTFAAVFLGGLAGASGMTLTFQDQTPSLVNRIRLYGTNATCNANIAFSGAAAGLSLYNGMTLAPCNPTGTQLYTGFLSGAGGVIVMSNGTAVFTAQNTFSGGLTPGPGPLGLGADSTPGYTSGPAGSGDILLAPDVGNLTGIGQLFAYGGAHTVGNPLVYPSDTNNLTLLVGGTNTLNLSGAYDLEGLDHTGGPISRTILATNMALTILSGVISDNGAGDGLIKGGAGVLVFSNNETYTGLTVVLAGTVLADRSLAGSVTVSTNATLGGSGTINGSVILTNGATLSPGNQAIGTLLVNGTVTMQSGSTNSFLISKTGNLKSVLSATAVNYGGVLFAANIAGTSAVGDSYTIVNAGSHTGSFTSVAGTPGPGLAWAFNSANGVLSVVSGSVIPNLPPKIIGVSLSGTNVTINATNGVSGGTYYLLGATNLALPIGQWTPLATNVITASGGSASFAFLGTNVVSAGKPDQYYILSSTNN